MADPRSTFWYLNSIPGEFIVPWSWRQTRGADPFVATFYASDDRFDSLKNPVALTVGAPDATMAGASLVTFENLFILAKERSLKGLREYTLVDVRWLLASGAFTGSFNVKGYKDKWRRDSIRADGVPYTRQQAIQIALVELIATISAREGRLVVPAPQITFDLADDSPLYEKLPENLGNSAGGGWVGAALPQFLPALLGGSADLVVARNGHLRITDKHATVVNGIDKGLILLDGILEKKEVRWQKPKRCVVQFEQRFGDTFAVIQGATGLSSYLNSLDPRNLALENVIPKYVVGGIVAENSGVSVARYESFEEYFQNPEVSAAGINEDLLRKRYLSPFLIPREDLNAAQRERAEVIESSLRACWRKWWRIKDTDDETNIRRKFADIQLGVLKADGTSEEMAVICDFEKLFKYPATPTDEEISRPVLDALSPFGAYWHNQEDLIIEIEQLSALPSVANVYLGALVERIKVPSKADIINFYDGLPLFECLGEFRREFTMRIYYHGLWVHDSDAQRKRLHEITYPLFDDGEIDSITTLYEGMTANWLRKHDESEHKLLNIEGIYLAAAERTAQIKKSFEQLRSGTVLFGGVDVLARTGIEPVGDLHEIVVSIGTANKVFEVSTALDFRPYVVPEVEYPELFEPARPADIG